MNPIEHIVDVEIDGEKIKAEYHEFNFDTDKSTNPLDKISAHFYDIKRMVKNLYWKIKNYVV